MTRYINVINEVYLPGPIDMEGSSNPINYYSRPHAYELESRQLHVNICRASKPVFRTADTASWGAGGSGGTLEGSIRVEKSV